MINSIPNLKSYATTSVGVALAQLISFAAVPLIAKLSGPIEYGNFGIIYSNLVIAVVLVSLKTELSLFILKGVTYRNSVPIITRFAGLSSLVITSILYFSDVLPEASNGTLAFLSVYVLLYGEMFFDLHIQKNIKDGNFKSNALQRIYKSILYPVIFLIAYTISKGESYYIIMSFGLSALVSTAIVNGFEHCKMTRRLGWKHITATALRARKTIFFMTPSHLLSRYSSNAFVVISGLQQGNATFVAMYLLAFKFIISPAFIITSANSDVVKREVLVNPIKGTNDYLKISIFSALVAGVVITLTVFLSEKIVVSTMGVDWKLAANFSIALLPLLFSILVFSPLTHVYIVLNRQDLDLAWQLLNTVAISSAIFFGLKVGFEYAVWCFSIVSSLSIFSSFLMCLFIVYKGKHDGGQ